MSLTIHAPGLTLDRLQLAGAVEYRGPVLRLNRGLPGSGKTTDALAWVAEDPVRRARVSRDDLRATAYDAAGVLTREQEEEVTRLQRALVAAHLAAGVSVVVDDTNLRQRFAREWATFAVEHGAALEVRDVPAHVDTCVARDAARYRAGGRHVGERVIRDMAAKFGWLSAPTSTWPAITPVTRPKATVTPYVPNEDLPVALLVDIDGTIAAKDLGPGSRGWYEYERVGEDKPVDLILDLAYAYANYRDAALVVMSGRDESCREQTEKWLWQHLPDFAALHMRPTGDRRADDIVKAELFDTHVRDTWNVVGALDDRNRVVAMWRAMGLTCLQVKDGDF